jgi:small subunit ribosomal protein S6
LTQKTKHVRPTRAQPCHNRRHARETLPAADAVAIEMTLEHARSLAILQLRGILCCPPDWPGTLPFCFDRSLAGATRDAFGRGGSRERGFFLRTDSRARFYELLAIAVPDGTPEELVETADSVAGYVTAAGGRVLRSSNDSPWGRRRLAYPIRHNSADLRDGFYTLYHFEVEPARIEDIERELRLNERVIRHLLLQLDSEPVFVEEVEEEVTVSEDAQTGEVTATEEIVVVAEDAATGEVEVVDETETVVVDEAGEVEAVIDEVDTAVVDETGAIETVDEQVDVAVVDETGEVEAVDEEVKIAKVEEEE